MKLNLKQKQNQELRREQTSRQQVAQEPYRGRTPGLFPATQVSRSRMR